MVFANLVDFSGGPAIQVVSFLPKKDPQPAAEAIHTQFASLKQWTPVALCGTIAARAIMPDKGKRLGNLDIELMLQRIHVLNSISDDLMFTRDSTFGPEDRHLQIRSDSRLRRALWSRAQIASLCRSELEKHGFLEVETPILFKSTPEGAREFLVPTRQKGLMYALPQSPQQYKQILMASGVRRYFQFAKCFRDEDLRADRQPEFTQLDLEMSFAGANDVMTVMEALVKRIWEERRTVLSEGLTFPLRRLSYHTAMCTYGSDKPDLRFDHSRIRDVTIILPHLQNGDPNLIVEAFALKAKLSPLKSPHYPLDAARDLFSEVFSRAELQAKEGDQPVIAFIGNSDIARNAELLRRAEFNTREQVSRFLSARNDEIVVIQARPRIANGGNTHLGLIRDALLKEGYARQIVSRAAVDEIVWITDFPLFKLDSESEQGQGGESGLSSTHHPFTAPRLEDIPLLETNPLQVKAEHFDLVVNGVEVGGGSARIHDAELQKYILEDIIKVPKQRLQQFDHLLKVLASGCPPHAGMALGYDRLIALLNGTDSVRDVIAFPKNGKGADPLIGSPGPVGDKDLQGYFLKQV
ncbi:tRNA synthetases class II-domain-containing protein [Tirmania nivea]|nr:tRNA synthetases class II-domain-containing protein [Tirmania nivea]